MITRKGKGRFALDIVGESFYQENIARVAGPKTKDGAKLRTTAIVECETDNPEDDQAVAVRIGGRLVGHLSREMARKYRKELSALAPTLPKTEVDALIVGGWKDARSEGHFGVKLDLDFPLRR